MRHLLLLGLLLLNSINLCAEQKLLQFNYLSTDEGLSNSQVVSVLQDFKGYMWIGTYDGLNKFDGTKFVVYRTNSSDSTTIAGNIATSIFEDSKKRLFIGTFEGLSLYNRDLDCFVNFKTDKNSALYGLQLSIFNITGDSKGNLWLATNAGLIYFNFSNNTAIQYQHAPNKPSTICDDFVKNVFVDSKERLWISTQNGLDVMDCKSGAIEHITHCATHNDNINGVYQCVAREDKKGNIWFGSNDGLFCLENNLPNHKKELVHYTHNPKDPNSLSHSYVISLFVDDDNNLWVGTENGGINLFDRQAKNFSHFRIDDYNPKSLNNESIWAFTQDRNKNIWVGTFGGGINASVNNSDFIVRFKSVSGAQQSLGHNIVKGFFEDKIGKIWVATDGGGLNLFDPKSQRFQRFNSQNSNLNSNAVLCLEQGEDNRIWLGTWAGGLVSFNPNTGLFNAFTTKNSAISDNNIHSIAKDKSGNLWLGSQNGGLIHYEVKKNKFTAYLPENCKINNKRVSVVEIDDNGLLYLGVNNSFQIFNPTTKQFITYMFDPADSTTISNNSIIDILIQNDTTVWITTGHGLNRFNPVSQTFKRYYTSDGLPNNLVFGVTLDKLGFLWVTTSYGICRFDYVNKKFKNFTKSDGLQGNEFTERSILTLKNGKILAGGKNGFNIITPTKIPANTKIPDVIITDFHIFNQPVPIAKEDSPLTKQISETKNITLSYKQSVLTFYFAVMDFTNPSRNQYAYKLEGFDDDWIYCGNKREATYTNLSPGKYLFHVKGSNNDGVWNNTGATLELTITPPWWETKIALLCIILFFISALLGAYFYRVRKLHEQKDLLEKLVEERTAELALTNEIVSEINQLLKERQNDIEQKSVKLIEQAKKLQESNIQLEERQIVIAEQSEELSVQKEELQRQNSHLDELIATKDKLFSILGHDLRSPFSAILSLSDVLIMEFRSYSSELIELQLGVMRDAASDTLTLLNNLLEWSTSQQGLLNLKIKEYQFSEVLKSELRLLRQQAIRKDVTIHQAIEGAEFLVEADLNVISTVMRNLVSNAIKFSKKSGSIYIVLNYQDTNGFTFSVKDEGVGMDDEKIKTLFKASTNVSSLGTSGEKGTGLGLLLCADFIEVHDGIIWAESEIGKGSTFFFTIPAKHPSF